MEQDHCRTIIHIDLDCFYAQVEALKNPKLINLPFGVHQQNFVITSNYVARGYGLKKCMTISEAKKLCPNLTLVNGEDLHDYRQMSYKVTNLLQKYSHLVERLGLDENFIDVSNLVAEKIQENQVTNIVGNIFGDTSNVCECGCSDKLRIGTAIAQEMRDLIKEELKLTCSAGIAHNKLLAKLVGSKHKPNKQTVLFPNSALELMLSLKHVSSIPSIGQYLSKQLCTIEITTIKDLQETDFVKIERLLGYEKAKAIYNLGFGIDNSPVKTSGKPQSIGIEDCCKSLSTEKEVKEKFKQLLNRLLLLIAEDGRIPEIVRITVRKFDKKVKISKRESRQCNISTSLFNPDTLSKLSESNENKLLDAIMRLFAKTVRDDEPYLITLLGLSFTKFLEVTNRRSNILTNFLVKDMNTSASETSAQYEPLLKKYKFSDLRTEKQLVDNYCPSTSNVTDELKQNSTEKSVKPTMHHNVCCPPNVDEEVFKELPKDIQQELWLEYNSNTNSSRLPPSKIKKSKPNTILNYLLKQ